MVAPLLLVGAGMMAGGMAGSIFGKKSVPKYDPTLANQAANYGANQEEAAIGNYMDASKKGIETFRGDVNAAGEAAKAESQSAAQDYLNNYDPITSRIVQNRTDALKRSTFGAIPELVQAAREAGAAGGGLDRGVIQSNLANIPMDQARQFNEGAANLETTAMQSQLDARSKVFDASNQLILNKLGIDSNSAQAILDSGNQTLIQQLHDLIDSSRNAVGIKINADAAAQGSAIGNVTNANANNQAANNAIMGMGGTLMGMGGGSAPVQNAGTNRTVISQGFNYPQTRNTVAPRYNGLPSNLSLR